MVESEDLRSRSADAQSFGSWMDRSDEIGMDDT